MWSQSVIITSIAIYAISFARMLWYTKKVFNNPYMGVDFSDFIVFSIWVYIPLVNSIGAILSFVKSPIKK